MNYLTETGIIQLAYSIKSAHCQVELLLSNPNMKRWAVEDCGVSELDLNNYQLAGENLISHLFDAGGSLKPCLRGYTP